MNQRQMKFEVEVIKSKLQIIGDPEFEQPIESTLIDLAEGEGQQTASVPQNDPTEHAEDQPEAEKGDQEGIKLPPPSYRQPSI